MKGAHAGAPESTGRLLSLRMVSVSLAETLFLSSVAGSPSPGIVFSSIVDAKQMFLFNYNYGYTIL